MQVVVSVSMVFLEAIAVCIALFCLGFILFLIVRISTGAYLRSKTMWEEAKRERRYGIQIQAPHIRAVGKKGLSAGVKPG
jgi:hypothetical protein